MRAASVEAVKAKAPETVAEPMGRTETRDAPPVPRDERPRREEARPMSRRRFVLKAAGGLLAFGIAGVLGAESERLYRLAISGTSGTPATTSPSEAQSFVSRPDLSPPVVRVSASGVSAFKTSPAYIFLSPRRMLGQVVQAGLMVIDRHGDLVWFKPQQNPFDFNAQSYGGRRVLTWWHGDINWSYGTGVGEIVDSSYRELLTVHAGNGLAADLHELNIVSPTSAFVTAYETTTADLSALGGSRHGRVFAGHAQEVDLTTGKVIFDWDSLDHVSPAESYAALPSSKNGSYDYFHINSVGLTPDGNVLISARNTWTIYKVDRQTGKIIWRLGGKKSDFSLGPGAHFYWQHHARMPRPDVLALFDDGGTPAEEQRSRGLILLVDARSMQVTLGKAYLNPAGFMAANQGSIQVLSDGRVFMGWGSQPYFSEFTPDGALLLDGQLPLGVRSYAAFTHDWVGRPTEPPSIAVLSDPGGGSIVYASWNGATEVRGWTVLAGQRPSLLEAVGSQAKSGFETSIAVNSRGPFFGVVASGAHGKELGRSQVIELIG